MNSDPDGFIGTLLAIEGISDARAVMNGPNGCRGNPAYFSDKHFPRENSLNRRSFEEPFFFGQSRIPCTYLESDDYINGSTQKLEEILPLIAKKGDAFLAVINSPGASLIGDDLNRFLFDAGLDNICMAFESCGYSKPFHEGFDSTIAEVLKWLRLNSLPKLKKRVNLLGFSISHKYWQGNVAEIKHICELMGFYVVSVPGAGSSVSEIRESATASCNIAVFPEYCKKTTEFYESEFGIPVVCSDCGAPVGFTSTEKWIKEVADKTGCDPTPALEEIRKKRTLAFHKISRYFHEAGYPKGATFAVRCDSSFALSLTVWLYEYLGMIPVSVEVMPGEDDFETTKRLKEYLYANNFAEAFNSDPYDNKPQFYFGEGLTGKDLCLSGRCKISVELFNRTNSDIYFKERAFLGGEGALWILELIFDAVKDFSE